MILKTKNLDRQSNYFFQNRRRFYRAPAESATIANNLHIRTVYPHISLSVFHQISGAFVTPVDRPKQQPCLGSTYASLFPTSNLLSVHTLSVNRIYCHIGHNSMTLPFQKTVHLAWSLPLNSKQRSPVKPPMNSKPYHMTGWRSVGTRTSSFVHMKALDAAAMSFWYCNFNTE